VKLCQGAQKIMHYFVTSCKVYGIREKKNFRKSISKKSMKYLRIIHKTDAHIY